MKLSKLIGLIAADKNSERLGEIVRIERLPHKLTKKETPHVLIIFKKFMKKDAIVPILAEKLKKVEGEYAWFDITKKEIEEEAKFFRRLKQKNFADYEELQDYAINLRHNYYFENKSAILRRQEKRRE